MDWSALFSTFGLVLVAELGDKTQLAVMTQACKYRTPWPIFLGGSLALIAVTALGALGGQVLNRLIPAVLLRGGAAAAFILMGILLWRERRQSVTSADDAAPCPPQPGLPATASPRWSWPAFGTTLGLLFCAELGDKTQLAVIALAGQQATPWLVWSAGSLALTIVTALGVIGGQALLRWFPERQLLRLSALLFIGMGILIALGIL